MIDGDLTVIRKWNGKSKALAWVRGALDEEHAKFDTTTKAQEGLDPVVGSYEVWRRTCVFSASDAAHFTLSTDAERKELLEALLGLGWFDLALTACRRDLKAATAAMAQAEHERELAVAKAEGLQSTLGQVEGGLVELPPVRDVGLARAEAARLAEMAKQAQAERDAVESLRRELARAGGRDEQRAADAIRKLDKLRGSADCFTCGQRLTIELWKAMERDIKTAQAAAQAAREKVAADLAAAENESSELAEEAEGLLNLVAKQRAGIAEIEQERSQREQLKRLIDTSRKEMDSISKRITDAEGVTKALAADVSELEACEQVLGVRGVRALVLGRTLLGIETLANTWMKRLSSTIEIKLRPYTEKKSGSTVDAISLSLVGAGGDSGYLGASAGERRRVDVAVLLALAELASADAGGAVWRSPIFFDEVFDSLDGEGREAVIELVERMAEDRCVVLITHDETVASAQADLRLRIDGGRVV
jgi:DNA repair exonuclease SbcCD ATPase subunit